MEEVERGLHVLLVFKDSLEIVIRIPDTVDPPPMFDFNGVLRHKNGKTICKKGRMRIVPKTAIELLPVYNEG